MSKKAKVFDGTQWQDIAIFGQDGLSAYELAVKNGFSGSEVEWLNSLPSILNITNHINNTSNPHGVTANQLSVYTNSEVNSLLSAKIEGPSSSTDNAIARFNSTTGKLIKNSSITISDEGNLLISPIWNNIAGFYNALKVNITDTSSASNSLLADLQVGGISRFNIDKDGNSNIYPIWNNSGATFTALKVNVTNIASATASYLLDFQIGGVSKFALSKTAGVLTVVDGFVISGPGTSNRICMDATSSVLCATSSIATSPWYLRTTAGNSNTLTFAANSGISWSNTDNSCASASGQIVLVRDSAHGVLAQRYSTTSQTFRIYNTHTDASNYERTSLGWSTNLFSIATENAGSGSARDLEFNVGGSKLHIKTDGSIYIDTAGRTVGNARGSGSLDLQLYRDTAGQVASGGDSVCIGQSNTASGNSSICVGIYNTNSGLRSFAAGVSNTITASPNTYGQFAIGESNVVAGQCSGAIGRNNITIAGYSGNLVLGERGEGKQYGAVIVGNGNTNAYGLSQLGMVPIYVQTTNATPASIGMHWYAETTAYDFMCHAKKAYKFRIDVVALSDVTDGYKTAAWEISGLITRDASNNTRIIGTPIITQIAADADAISGGWTVTIQANDTTDKLQVLATGEFNTIIRWTGSIFWAEVGHA